MRKALAILVCFISGNLGLLAQNQDQPEYYLIEGGFTVDSVLISNISKVKLDTASKYSVVFLYGSNYHKTTILSQLNDTLVQRVNIERQVKTVDTTIYFQRDSVLSEIFDYIDRINGQETLMLFAPRFSSISDGYIYFVYEKSRLIGSFCSYHGLEHFQLSEEDLVKLRLLQLLIADISR